MTAPREVAFPVTRHARLALWGGEGEEAVRETWILLHGYRQLAPRFLRHFRILFEPHRFLVAPEGLSRFYLEGTPGPHRGGDPVGASWMTREARELEITDYVAYLDRVLAWAETARDGTTGTTDGGGEDAGGEGAPVLRVVGFSQGVHTAARWVAGGNAFAETVRPGVRLILWGASLPGDLPSEAESRFRGLESLVLVRGREDPLRDGEGEDREEALLERWGVPYRIVHHPGSHRIDGRVLRTLA